MRLIFDIASEHLGIPKLCVHTVQNGIVRQLNSMTFETIYFGCASFDDYECSAFETKNLEKFSEVLPKGCIVQMSHIHTLRFVIRIKLFNLLVRIGSVIPINVESLMISPFF